MKKEVEQLREEIEALVTQAYQQDAEDDAALGSRRVMSCPPSWRDEKTACRTIEALLRLESQAKPRPRPSASGVPQLRWNAGARAKSVVAEPKEVDKTPDDKAQMSFHRRHSHYADQQQGWDYCGNAQASVDGAHRSLWPVTSRLRPTTSSWPCPWPS